MLRDIKIKQTQEIVIKNTFMNSNIESDEPDDKKPIGDREKKDGKNKQKIQWDNQLHKLQYKSDLLYKVVHDHNEI